MPVVASWDWPNRRIYMAVPEWHPIDLYREHREERRLNENARKHLPMMRMDGNVAKGGGKATPRYVVMLEGAKIVPVDGTTEPRTTITGEIITDDQTDFVDISPLTVKPFVQYQPPEAEIIQVTTSGNEYSLPQISDAVWQRAIESGLTAEQFMRLILASAGNNLSIDPDGTVRLRDVANTKDRLVVTTNEQGERLSVTRDAS